MRVPFIILLLMSGPAHAAEEACLASPYTSPATAQQRAIADLFDDIRPLLPELPSLAEALEALAPTVCLAATLDGAEGFFDPESNRITLHSDLPAGLMLGILLHEMRHVEQYARGFCPSNSVLMQENARAVFALEADASAISLMAAWQLKSTGQPAAWDALAAWPTQQDIAARFAADMTATGDVAAAVAGAFDQWYVSRTRVDRYYVSSCSDFLDRQDATNALPSYGTLRKNFLTDLYTLPDASSYACREPDQGD